MNASKMNRTKLAGVALALTAGLLWAANAHAAITWVEVDGSATDGSVPDNDNTTVSSGTIESDGFDGNTTDSTDGNWDEWDGGPEFGSIALIARGSETAGTLTTTLDLALDTGVDYNLFVLFRSDEFTQGSVTDQEGINVKLDSDVAFQAFDRNTAGVQQFGTSDFYYADFATVTGVAGTDTVTINVEQFFTDFDGQFTVYDAIGFEVVPEPATLALLGLGGAVILGGRNKRRA